MPIICCVPGCRNRSGGNFSFNRFPKKNTELRKKWIEIIKSHAPRNYSRWEPTRFNRICGEHFNLSGRKKTSDRFPKYFYLKKILVSTPKLYYFDDLTGEVIIPNNKLEFGKSENNHIVLPTSVRGEAFVEQIIHPLKDHDYCLDDAELSVLHTTLKKSLHLACRESNEKDVKINSLKNELLNLKAKLEETEKKLNEKMIESNHLKNKLREFQQDPEPMKLMNDEEASEVVTAWEWPLDYALSFRCGVSNVLKEGELRDLRINEKIAR